MLVCLWSLWTVTENYKLLCRCRNLCVEWTEYIILIIACSPFIAVRNCCCSWMTEVFVPEAINAAAIVAFFTVIHFSVLYCDVCWHICFTNHLMKAYGLLWHSSSALFNTIQWLSASLDISFVIILTAGLILYILICLIWFSRNLLNISCVTDKSQYH